MVDKNRKSSRRSSRRGKKLVVFISEGCALDNAFLSGGYSSS